METVWDWTTLFCFAGLITLFLHRSNLKNPTDSLWQYGPPALGCAAANYLGNEGVPIAAGAVIVGAFCYVYFVLKFPRF